MNKSNLNIMRSKQTIILVGIFLISFRDAQSTVYLIDIYSSKMVELPDNDEPCVIHEDRIVMQNTLNRVDPVHVQTVSPDTLNEVSNMCRNPNRINKTGGFIFPGTKWCGPGNVANGYHDLGVHTLEDRCCRDHDHCPNQLEPGQCRNGICNISPFTRLHCDCDDMFKKCLRDVNTDIANVLGSVYFNIARNVCFRERRFCPKAMRDNLSYSWFCEEWKFVPVDNFIPSSNIKANNVSVKSVNNKSEESSKINADLDAIFGDDEDVKKIINKT